MEINGLAGMAMAVNKAEVGQNILDKTLEKTAEVEQRQKSKGHLQVQASKSPSSEAAMTGKGTRIDVFA